MYQRNILASTIHWASLEYGVFKTQLFGNPSFTLSNITRSGLLLRGFPCSKGVGRFAPMHAGWSFEKSFLIQPLSGISHQKNIVTLTVHRVSPLPRNVVFFFTQRLLEPLDSVKFWLCQAFSHVDCLLHQSWVICTNSCGIEL